MGMAILNITLCKFIVFSSWDNSFIVIDVHVDKEFVQGMLIDLQTKFFTKMLHNICLNF